MPKPKENISKQLNIILFNYVQPTERNNPGGGVTIYLRNLSSALRSKGHRVITLSAGDRYNPFWPTPYLDRPTEDELIIVNSPVVAPAAFSFHHPDIYLSNQSINKIPNRIKKEISTVNVFHFHNIEGLTYEFFASLRKEFPKSAMLFSAHNYNIVCPQVNLWKNDNISCSDFDDGIACLTCTPKNLSRSRKIIINALKTPIKYLDKSKGPLSKILYQTENLLQKKSTLLEINYHPNTPTPKPTADSPASHKKPQQYIDYRKAGISLINNFFDRTIAVSEQTKRILLSLGADEKNIKTSYIGTKHMERMNSMKRKLPSCRDLHICYMGYMRKDKGFFFFLNTLNQLPPDTASQINVTIAAKFTDIEATKMMESLAKKFRTFRAFDGYTHDQLQHILAPVNLGIIPALWEDNLPQVAIEFVTHGIPILTSHLGGAKEISNNPFYVFDIAKPSSLCEKLCNFVESDSPIPDFWNGTLQLRSNEQHVEEILRIYDEVIARRRA